MASDPDLDGPDYEQSGTVDDPWHGGFHCSLHSVGRRQASRNSPSLISPTSRMKSSGSIDPRTLVERRAPSLPDSLAAKDQCEMWDSHSGKKPSGRPKKKRKLATKEDVTQSAYRQLSQLEIDRVDPSEAVCLGQSSGCGTRRLRNGIWADWRVCPGWRKCNNGRPWDNTDARCHAADEVAAMRQVVADNYRGSRVNELVDVRHKMTLPELDITLQVAREVWRAHGKAVPLSLCKRDHREAYRQVPMNPVESMWSTVVLRDLEGRYQGFKHRVYPFCVVRERISSAEYLSHACGQDGPELRVAVKEEKDVACTQKATAVGVEINTEILGTVECKLGAARRDALLVDIA
ncbi:hypothetical protein Pmar_PMAR009630 [Perkinsus marinus ATCC 50983]|uniref:Uncharacterized protein n=1 Tax=Perkinsus marinus (strain ATCC 50983 / TXsc) TaxID=423536 RepID=C5M013_PERM5|nr:hypothetical protein Pmar_PMAR009630 [Perkinsus marinus ATCC 50983]EEQ97671.1 hypothetical protein Pmar_PMAR009630 [Perkinsus marinus ATCC 50983]|eukprot:XP_002764954.1 hypothetical protein Pmar_PMAR009630 [Perkinsus marinus ATCC 50983]